MAEEAKPEEPKAVDNRTRPQKRKDLYEANTRERQEAATLLKIEYKKVKDSPAVKHLLVKMRQFADWHTKVAKDGVGFEEHRNDSGQLTQNTVYLSPEKRLQELDRAAGIEEIITYLEGQLAEEAKPKEVAAPKS